MKRFVCLLAVLMLLLCGCTPEEPTTVPTEPTVPTTPAPTVPKVETVQQRQDIARVSQDVSQRIAEKYGMTVVPTATAWEAVRDNGVVLEDERFPGDFSLTSRFMAGGVYSFDKYHDGDIGGGQYLNACVWYETLTGLSCKENKFLPSYDLDGTLYSLSGKKIKLLQKTAHNAVANNK